MFILFYLFKPEIYKTKFIIITKNNRDEYIKKYFYFFFVRYAYYNLLLFIHNQ